MAQPRCAVLVHVYYPELWDEIARCLQNLNGTHFDLHINAVHGRTTPQWRNSVISQFPRAQVHFSPNLGEDVGGTVSLLAHVDLSRYDLICKLHTKKSTYDPVGGEWWRTDLLGACLDKPHEVFEAFSDPRVTMVASGARVSTGNGMNHRQVLRLCERLKLDRRLASSPWVAGTMFWCRPYVMQALKDAGIRQDEFVCAYGFDGTLAHAIERIFGALAASRGEIFWRAAAPRRFRGIGRAEPLPNFKPRRSVRGVAGGERLTWFFCLSDGDPQFTDCARVAVQSSERYELNRICLYDGGDEAVVDWLQDRGVRVVRHRFSLARELSDARVDDPAFGLGTFMRIDIPEVAQELGLLDGSHYLYTDCDVVFQNEPSGLLDIETETFCAAMELHEDQPHFNAGVMWCNAGFFRQSLAEFRRFVVQKRFRFVAYDQGALNEFYGSSRQVLGREYNWKPYWGVDENAAIVHFHGPKPQAFRLWQRNPQEFARRFPTLVPFLGPHTRAGYERYVAQFERLLELEAAEAASA